MNNKQLNQFIGYAITAIIAYFILQTMMPFLIYGVIGMIAWRIYLEYKK